MIIPIGCGLILVRVRDVSSAGFPNPHLLGVCARTFVLRDGLFVEEVYKIKKINSAFSKKRLHDRNRTGQVKGKPCGRLTPAAEFHVRQLTPGGWG
jgi:hypothetical protein